MLLFGGKPLTYVLTAPRKISSLGLPDIFLWDKSHVREQRTIWVNYELLCVGLSSCFMLGLREVSETVNVFEFG